MPLGQFPVIGIMRRGDFYRAAAQCLVYIAVRNNGNFPVGKGKQQFFTNKGRIALVIASRTDAYALERARNEGIPTETVVRKEYAERLDFTLAVMDKLAKYEVDLVVFSGFMYILSPVFTDTYRNRAINVHPALIPSFCGDGYYGLKVHEEALAYGVKLSGATVHFANEITDGGPIIMQKAVTVMENDTPKTLQERVMSEAEQVILPLAVEKFCADKLIVNDNKVTVLD